MVLALHPWGLWPIEAPNRLEDGFPNQEGRARPRMRDSSKAREAGLAGSLWLEPQGGDLGVDYWMACGGQESGRT